MKNKNKSFRADAIGSYFRLEWLPLLFVTLSGLVYNVGLLAGPWYEGRLAQCLADILGGNESCREHGCARARLYSRHASRAGSAVYQALLCPPLCQQHQPPDEGHPLRRSGAAEPRVSGKGGRGRADDQSHLRRGRLRGGHAEIHHRDLRYRRGACRLYGDAARVRLAARAAQFALYAGILCMRRADEKTGAARGRGV